MRVLRYLLWMVLLPGTALAANPDWLKLGSTTAECSFGPGSVCSFQWTASANSNSDYLQTGGSPFSLRLEPHVEGSGTAATAAVYACTRPSADACSALNFIDTDGDGLVDSNTLTSSPAAQIGTPVFMGVAFIYVDPTANPASGTAEVTAIAERVQ